MHSWQFVLPKVGPERVWDRMHEEVVSRLVALKAGASYVSVTVRVGLNQGE